MKIKKIIIFGLIIILVLSSYQISAFQLSRDLAEKNTNLFVNNPLMVSTFLGGDNNDGMYYTGVNIIQDNQGNFIIAGTTESNDFPITVNSLYQENKGNSDIFITKMNSDFTEVLASTYIGGSNKEEARGIDIDQDGNIFICGITESSDFPVSLNGFQIEYKGGTEAPYGSGDVFVIKINSNLDSLLSSTYLGGNGHESCSSIGVNSAGDIILSGLTSSSNFPISENAYDKTYNSGGYFKDDVFVTIFSNDLSQIISSTYIGGSHDDFTEALTIDSLDNIFISGWTRSSNYPTTEDSFDTSFGGVYDGFITKFNKDLTDIISSTYLGGTQWDFCYGLDIDNDEDVYVTGHTASINFPTTSNVFCRNYQGRGGANVGDDAFVSKLSNNLTFLLASTYLGGDNWESGFTLDISNNDMIYVAGTTSSYDFPVLNSFSDAYSGGVTHNGDMFISCLNSDLSMLPASTYLGGSVDENSGQIIIDEVGDIIISGASSSLDFPIDGIGYDNSHNGYADVVLTKFEKGLSDNNPPEKPIISGPVSGKSGESYEFSVISQDDENNEIYFLFDWGDETISDWLGPYSSNEECIATYIWNENGEYSIKVKAKDDMGLESEWSDPLIMSVPKSKIIQHSSLNNDLSWEKHRICSDFGSASSLKTCDLNGDDNIDFLGTSWDLKQICWWHYDDDQPYNWNKLLIDESFNGSAYVDVNDVDGDGDLDVIGAAWYDGEISWWENDGQIPISWSKNIIKTGYGEAHEVYSCDFDGDGDIDIFAASAELNEITWWRNIGDSMIDWQEQKIGDCFGARSVFVDDLDSDGDNDVLGADFDRGNICWWRNDGGDPIIWSKFFISNDFSGAHHVSTFDIDDDGDVDVIGASAIGNDIILWLNNEGNPIEWIEYIIDDNFRGALKVSVADIDDDQDYDIIGTSVNSNKISWWRNENEDFTNWTKKTVDIMCVGAWPLDIDDIDGDGDIDILGGGSSSISWYENDLYCDSNLDCEGNFKWIDITPGTIINESFVVKNIGKDGSDLNWEIIEYPDWGVWTFNPSDGSGLSPNDGELLVEVTVIVPDEKNSDFSGKIILSNNDASGDYDEISVLLSTSLYKKCLKINLLRLLNSFFRFVNI